MGIVDIYFNEELSAGDPAGPGPRQGGCGTAREQPRLYQRRAGKEPADPSGACVAIKAVEPQEPFS